MEAHPRNEIKAKAAKYPRMRTNFLWGCARKQAFITESSILRESKLQLVKAAPALPGWRPATDLCQ